MMNRSLLILAFLTPLRVLFGQSGYDIRINLKNGTDTTVFLARYFWDQLLVADSCKKIKKGQIRFTGKEKLEPGVYFITNQGKDNFYFQFIVDDQQTLNFAADQKDVYGSLNAKDKLNSEFFSYASFMIQKNKEIVQLAEQHKGKADSAAIVNARRAVLSAETKTFDEEFMRRNKGNFVYDLMNLKSEKEATEVPKAKNGRPDSLYQYYYYKDHYFDGVNFKDERIIRTPFFADRVKKYFDNVILQHPDTIIQEIDKLMAKCEEGSRTYNVLLGHFSYKYENSKIMGFDKIFVHLADKYIISGRANGLYDEETVKKIKDRVDIMRNLLLGAKAPDLYLLDSTDAGTVRKWGFDTASSSGSLTKLYYQYKSKLDPMFKTLYQIKAKYTVLVFWASDCGHCQTEVPKLHEDLKALKGTIDFKVVAVQTKDDLFYGWKKFIIDKKLSDFQHYIDPVHLNNLKVNYDIYSTPVIYILDKDKNIKAKRLGAEQVIDMLKNLEMIEKAQQQQKN